MISKLRGGPRLPLHSYMVPIVFIVGLIVTGVTIPFLVLEDQEPTSDPVIVGLVEWVEASTRDADTHNRIRVRAKIDTGAESSSIDTELAHQLGVDMDEVEDTQRVRSALGREERPVFEAQLRLGGQTLDTRLTIADRSDLTYPMLIGSNDLKGFLVDSSAEKLTTPRGELISGTTAGRHRSPVLTASWRELLAPIPLAAALIVGVRTVIGLQTFGVFAPILLGVTLAHTGVFAGSVTFATMLGTGLLTHFLTRRLKLPHIARLAVLLTAVVLSLLLLQEASFALGLITFANVNSFPLVVMAAIVERFSANLERQQLKETLKLVGWTFLVAAGTSWLLQADLLEVIAERYPLLLVALGAVLAILLGSYRGLRLTELLRFQRAASAGPSA